MMTSPLISRAPGTCDTCREPIARGEPFLWGRSRGSRVHPRCQEKGAGAVGKSNGARSGSEPDSSRGFSGSGGGGSGNSNTTMDDFEPSSYQEAIGNAVHDTDDSIEVNALAGTGKTSTIEWIMRHRLPDSLANETVLLQAFNKRIAEEAQARMPAHVLASTMHSGGLKAVTAAFGRVRVDARGQKVKRLIRDLAWGRLRDEELKTVMYPLTNLIGKGKDAGVGHLEPNKPETWQRLIDHYDLDIPASLTEKAIGLAHDVLEANNQDTREADFGDMIYWPILFDLPVQSFPFVGVDEAQDLNEVQRAMLPKLVRPGGRLMATGDRRQSIYAWRGATPESMDLIRQLFGARQLPLNLNYRCSKAVIAETQLLVPEIEARPWAPEGSVEVVDSLQLADFLPTDAVLCRTNAPLIRLAYRFLSAGIGCIVLGRDIGRGLIAMIDRVSEGHADMGLDHLARLVYDWISAEEKQARIRDREDKAQMARDKGESLLAAIESVPADRRTIPQLREQIESLFSDKGTGLTTLSTVHKAKGLEWQRVFILDPHRMPSPWARQPWQITEETNIRYVAVTRAKMDLRYVESEDIS